MNALLVSLLLATSHEPACDTWQAMHDMVSDATRVFAGIDEENTTVVEVFVAPDGDSWIIILNGIGQSCIASQGRDARVVLPLQGDGA